LWWFWWRLDLMIMKRQCNWRVWCHWFNLVIAIEISRIDSINCSSENPTFIIYNSQFTIFFFFITILSVD
jgi:hypothetical protein